MIKIRKYIFFILFFLYLFLTSKEVEEIEYLFEIDRGEDKNYGKYFIIKEIKKNEKFLVGGKENDFRIVPYENFYEFLKELSLDDEAVKFLKKTYSEELKRVKG